jgi:hypothetical protein
MAEHRRLVEHQRHSPHTQHRATGFVEWIHHRGFDVRPMADAAPLSDPQQLASLVRGVSALQCLSTQEHAALVGGHGSEFRSHDMSVIRSRATGDLGGAQCGCRSIGPGLWTEHGFADHDIASFRQTTRLTS